MRQLKQSAATRMHSGRLDPVGLTINFKVTPSRFNHFLRYIIRPSPSQYLMVPYFMRYYTRTTISHGFIFHEILNQNQTISWLQISLNITPVSQYLTVADFMRYYTRTPISHVSDFMRYYTKPIISHRCRFPDILLQNHNISWLKILWYVTPEP